MQLTTDEAEELAELLTSALGDLRWEIADTDNWSFKSGLRGRKRRLQSVLDKLQIGTQAI